MATSGSDDFEAQRNDIIAEALENVGAIGIGDSSGSNNAALFTAGARSLNRVVKSIDKEGQFLWRIVRRTTTTTDGTATFSPASDVLAIDEPMRYTRSGETSATILTAMSRDDYMRVPDRTIEGLPRQYFWEKTLTSRTVTLYPVPDATGDTIEYAASVRADDFDASTDTPDFPSKWTSCLVYGLTMELAPKFGQAALVAQFKPLFEDELRRLVNDDTEHGSMILSPMMSGGGAG